MQTKTTSSMQEKTTSTMISMDFGEEASDAIREIQRLGRYKDIHDAMQHILGTGLYLHKRRVDGWRVLITRGREYKEVDFVDS